MDHILIMNSTVHNAWYEWVRVIIILPIALLARATFRSTRTWLWPKYKQRYEKYCIIEEKINNALDNLSESHD